MATTVVLVERLTVIAEVKIWSCRHHNVSNWKRQKAGPKRGRTCENKPAVNELDDQRSSNSESFVISNALFSREIEKE